MKFNKHDLRLFGDLADKHEIVIVEGKNGIGQKFKTMGCFMPEKNAMDEYLYIQDSCFALFQGQYGTDNDKLFCAFYINPDDNSYAGPTPDCLFVETIKTRNGQPIYSHPNFMRVQAYNLYNKALRPSDNDYTPSKLQEIFMMHIGKPMILQDYTGTLTQLETIDEKTFATLTNGTSANYIEIEHFDMHLDTNAKKNLLDYSNEIQNER